MIRASTDSSDSLLPRDGEVPGNAKCVVDPATAVSMLLQDARQNRYRLVLGGRVVPNLSIAGIALGAGMEVSERGMTELREMFHRRFGRCYALVSREWPFQLTTY